VPKESARLEAYGTTDELNSIIGIVRTYLPQYRAGFGADFEAYSESLRRIQNELFDVGSELATPPDGEYPQMHKMGAGEIKKLEEEMDAMEKELEPLKFVQSRWVAKRLGEPEFLWDRALRIEEDKKTAHAAQGRASRGAKS
jgi:ATP:cob(I)alamin adenosyltransferase